VKSISLFAGAGGDSLGLKNAGFEVIGFVEFWDKAVKTHKLNFPESRFIGECVKGDITKITDDELRKYENKIDILFAGFPCQGFSHAGKKDPSDLRNKLFWEFIRATEIIKPKWIIGENVAGLVHRKTDDGKAYIKDVIVNEFQNIGYKMAEPTVLKAEQYGIPQKRRRVFFVGSREGIDFKFPEPTTPNNFPGLSNILTNSLDNAEEIDNSIVHEFNSNATLNITNKELSGKPHPYLLRKIKSNQISYRRRISPHHIEMIDPTAPAKTIHCGYSFQPRLFVGLTQNKKTFLREFTLNELAQIQGFPKDYKFFGNRDDIIKQIGNAVPPKLVEELARKIINSDSSIQKPARETSSLILETGA